MATLDDIIRAMAETHDVLDVDGAVEDVISGLDRARALGWVLVPVDATDEMRSAAFQAWELSPNEGWDIEAIGPEIYAAMINAAPKIGEQ